jgi:hypothetical protein
MKKQIDYYTVIWPGGDRGGSGSKESELWPGVMTLLLNRRGDNVKVMDYCMGIHKVMTLLLDRQGECQDYGGCGQGSSRE